VSWGAQLVEAIEAELGNAIEVDPIYFNAPPGPRPDWVPPEKRQDEDGRTYHIFHVGVWDDHAKCWVPEDQEVLVEECHGESCVTCRDAFWAEEGRRQVESIQRATF
jgi:heat shock protein HspQ